MKSPLHEDPRILATAEGQMLAWAHYQEMADQLLHLGPSSGTVQGVCYVTVSRQAGAGGSEIAALLGKRVGWPVYDKNLIDHVAQRYHEPRLMLDLVDETPANWVYDVIGTWMDRHIVTHQQYAAQLGRIIRWLARQANSIFVGRGAQFLLPRDHTLAVRIVASMRHRVARTMRIAEVGPADARQMIQETDLGRKDYLRRFFHYDPDDPVLYDLVLNAERFEPARAVDVIVAAMTAKRPEAVKPK